MDSKRWIEYEKYQRQQHVLRILLKKDHKHVFNSVYWLLNIYHDYIGHNIQHVATVYHIIQFSFSKKLHDEEKALRVRKMRMRKGRQHDDIYSFCHLPINLHVLINLRAL